MLAIYFFGFSFETSYIRNFLFISITNYQLLLIRICNLFIAYATYIGLSDVDGAAIIAILSSVGLITTVVFG